MNTYTYRFSVLCPTNGMPIDYTLVLETPRMVKVEDLMAACDVHTEGYQEDLAKALHTQFGGKLALEANHHGVHIRTVLQ